MTYDPHFVPWPPAVAAQFRAQGVWQGITLSDFLNSLARRFAERTAVIDARGSLSYGQLYEQSCQLARGFQEMGIRRGDAVIVQMPNRRELLLVWFALFRIGARPIMAQPAHRQLELTQFARLSAAVAHVCCDAHARFDYRVLARAVRGGSNSLRHTVVLGEAEEHTDLSSLFLREGELPALGSASDIALFQLSGGSTDVPKLIARTHDDYLYSVRQSVAVCGFDESTRYLVALPAAHNFPLSSPGILGALSVGGTVVLAEDPTPDALLDLIAREHVTVTALVPALVPPLLACAARRPTDKTSLRLLQVGGAKLHPTLAQRVQSELCPLQQVFGMAEGLVCYTRIDAPPDLTVSSQGLPMSPLDELRVVDEQDQEVAPGEVGDLLTRGPYTIRGYYNAPEHNARAFTTDGFYRTGDRVRRLPDGSVVVEGRSKDQINRGGEKIAAPEVEAQLLSHPAVQQAALVGVPDPALGERSWAFVVLSEAASPAQLLQHLRAAGLASYKLPDRFHILESMPKTAVGKIDKRALRERAASDLQHRPQVSAIQPAESQP